MKFLFRNAFFRDASRSVPSSRRIPFLAALAILGLAAQLSSAQVTSPIPGPYPKDDTPRPFNYPEGLNAPQFTFEENPAAVIHFGDFPVLLGKTRLSVLTKAFGGELHHLPDRTDYLCYSAPIATDIYAPKKRKKKTAVEEPVATPIGQNIWLIVGSRGEISEARAEVIYEEGQLCHRLPEAFENVSFGALKIGMTLSEQAQKKEGIPPASVIAEDSPWRFWFANTGTDRFNLHYGFLGAELSENNKINRLFSIELEFKGK